MVGLGSKEDVEATHIEDYLFPQDLPQVLQTVIPAIISNGRWAGEFRFRHFINGNEITVLWDAFAVKDPTKRGVINFATVTKNITELKTIQKRLIKSETLFRLLFESAPIGILIGDLSGKPSRCNLALQRMLGYSEEEIKKIGIRAFSNVEDYEIDFNCFSELLSGKLDSYTMEKRYITKSGATVWGELRVAIIRNTEMQDCYAISMIQDITEKKQYLQEREKIVSEEKYHVAELEATLAAIPDGIIIYGPNLEIFMENESARRCSG